MLAGKTLSFTMIGEDGVAKSFSVSSSKIEFANSAILRNHNENPKSITGSTYRFSYRDDKTGYRVYDVAAHHPHHGQGNSHLPERLRHGVMWRGNTDDNHSFSPDTIIINHLVKWKHLWEILEGTFSGTATLKDHNDFSNTSSPV